MKDKIKFSKEMKKDIFLQIKANMEVDEDEFILFKNSPYYTIRQKCGKKTKMLADLKERLREHPKIIEYERRINNYNMEIEDLRVRLEYKIVAHKEKVKKIKNMLKDDFNELEKNVLSTNIRTQQKLNKVLVKHNKQDTRKEVKHLIGAFDALLYFYLVYLILCNIKNIWIDPRLRIILLILLAMVFVFGFGVGNFGTGIRHRSKFAIIFILLAAPLINRFILFKKQNKI